MRTIQMHGIAVAVYYAHNPGRFPRRRHIFTGVLGDIGISIGATTPRKAWRGFDLAVRDHVEFETNFAVKTAAGLKWYEPWPI